MSPSRRCPRLPARPAKRQAGLHSSQAQLQHCPPAAPPHDAACPPPRRSVSAGPPGRQGPPHCAAAGWTGTTTGTAPLGQCPARAGHELLCRPDMHTRGCSREAACQWRDAPARLTPWPRAGPQSEHAGRPAPPASPAGPPARSGLRGVWGTQSRAWACENTAQRAQEVRVFGRRVDKSLACLPAPRTRAPPPTGPHPAGCGPVCGRCRTPAPPGSSRPPAAVEAVKEGQRGVRLRASHTGLNAQHPVCSLERTGRWHTAVTSACRSESIFWRCCTANADDAIGG